MADWQRDLLSREREQSGEPAFGSLEWARKALADPPPLTPADRLILARTQTQFALGCLMGGPEIGLAIAALEEALDHARNARPAIDPRCSGSRGDEQ